MTDLTRLVDKELREIKGYGDYSDAYRQLEGALRALKVCIEALADIRKYSLGSKADTCDDALAEVRRIVGGAE